MKSKDSLVKLLNNVPVVSSLDIVKELGVEYKTAVSLFRKYKNRFEGMGIFSSSKEVKEQGRPIEVYYLNEKQAIFLITLMKNSESVVNLKDKLSVQFCDMREMLLNIASQKQNTEWLETRQQSRLGRVQETDVIKKFVEYAIAQGSTRSDKYYMLLTKAEYAALFIIEQEFKNIRNALNLNQLSTIINADAIVSKALEDGMQQGIKYQDIYQLAKKRLELFAELRGKSVVPSFDAPAIAAPKTPKRLKKATDTPKSNPVKGDTNLALPL